MTIETYRMSHVDLFENDVLSYNNSCTFIILLAFHDPIGDWNASQKLGSRVVLLDIKKLVL